MELIVTCLQPLTPFRCPENSVLDVARFLDLPLIIFVQDIKILDEYQ